MYKNSKGEEKTSSQSSITSLCVFYGSEGENDVLRMLGNVVMNSSAALYHLPQDTRPQFIG